MLFNFKHKNNSHMHKDSGPDLPENLISSSLAQGLSLQKTCLKTLEYASRFVFHGHMKFLIKVISALLCSSRHSSVHVCPCAARWSWIAVSFSSQYVWIISDPRAVQLFETCWWISVWCWRVPVLGGYWCLLSGPPAIWRQCCVVPLSSIWPPSIAQSQLWVVLFLCCSLQLGTHPRWVFGKQAIYSESSASLVYLLSLALHNSLKSPTPWTRSFTSFLSRSCLSGCPSAPLASNLFLLSLLSLYPCEHY